MSAEPPPPVPDQPKPVPHIRITRKFGQFDVGEYDEHGRQAASLDSFESLAAAQAAYPQADVAPEAAQKSTQWSARRIRQIVLLLVIVAAIGVLAGWVASLFVGTSNAVDMGGASVVAAGLILRLVPVRISAATSKVFPGPAESLFQLAIDPNLGLQVSGNPRGRRLVKQTGRPGQPGSTWVTEGEGVTLTTTVLSSDPPRKLVTTAQSRQQQFEVTA